MNFSIIDFLSGVPQGILQILLIIVVFLAVFIPAVTIHEFGHLILAKLSGVRVSEFGIGMPFSKRLFYKRKFGIIWSFYPWLLGGFARIYGDNDAIDRAHDTYKDNPKETKEEYIQSRLDEIIANRDLEFFLQDNNLEYTDEWKKFEKEYSNSEIEETEQTERLNKQLSTLIAWEFDKEIQANDVFFSKSWIKQTLILLGGVTFNLATAVVCFWLIFGIFNVPQGQKFYPLNDIGAIKSFSQTSNESDYINLIVADNGAASNAGITREDKIYSLGGVDSKDIDSFDQVSQIISSSENGILEIAYQKPNSSEMITEQIQLNGNGCKYYLGIANATRDIQIDGVNVFKAGFAQTANYAVQGFEGIGKIVKSLLPTECDRSALNNLAGPVAASSVGSRLIAQTGISGYLLMLALISISLAVFNLLPIPALDGGRFVIVTLNKLIGKRNRKLETLLISITFLALMGLGLVILTWDIWRVGSGTF